MVTNQATTHAPTQSLDHLFGALSDPTRRVIVDRLTLGEATVGELAAPFEMSRPAISKHLRVLERAGLVDRRIEGRVTRCSLRPDSLRQASEWVDRYRRFWEDQLDRFSAYLDETADASERDLPNPQYPSDKEPRE